MSYKYKSAGSILAALLTVASPRLLAQAAPAATTAEDKDESIVLSPFVVSASEDAGGYAANSTLAGTRVRTDLKDVASAISVVTQQFLQDTGATNNQDLLVYTPSTEVGGIGGNFSGAAGHATFTENLSNTATRVRGLDSADNTRDYYLTDIPWDSFNVGRVDLQRGPNSILFGIGSPAGIINTSTNGAAFKTAYNYENRIDGFGTLRNSADLNQVLVADTLAIRVAALVDDKRYEQKPAYNNTFRYYGALRFDPKLFNSDSAHTSIRANYEKGRVRSDNPRDLPPIDDITPWFKTGTDVNGNLGLNKLTVNQYGTNAIPAVIDPNTHQPTQFPGGTGGSLTAATYELGGNAETRSYWPDIINYYEATPVAKNVNPSASFVANQPGGTPIKTIAAEANTAKAIPDTTNNGARGIGGLGTFRPLGIPSTSSYDAFIGSQGTQGGFIYPQHAVPGGVYYASQVLTDPSIFNFYKQLLDGSNKHEWQNWQAFNIAVDQTFFEDRVGLEVAFDHQSFDSGQNQWLAGDDYNINVDVNQTYADGTPNPNVGRPYVGDAESNQNGETFTTRNTFRATLTGELRAEDFLGKTKLADILGRHVFTGLYDRNTVVTSNRSWAEYATTADYILDNVPNIPGATPNTSSLNSNRDFDWIAYLGPSLATSSSAHGANLGFINYTIAPPTNQQAYNFDATWTKSNAPGAANYVDPTATAAPTTSATPVAGYTVVGGPVPIAATDSAPATTGLNYYNPNGYYAPGHTPADAEAAYLAHQTNPAVALVPVYSYINNVSGVAVSTNQSQNPANYVGWTQQPINWMRASNPADFPSLVESASRQRFRDISTGFTWQGHLLGGDLVPTYGYRKDRITNYDSQSRTDPNTGFTSLDFQDDLGSRNDVAGISHSWGGVYHLPKSLTDRLPWGSTISLFYDHSNNFKADSERKSLSGLPIPNANGLTKEYGVTLTTLHDKLSLKISRFKTKVSNATLADTNGNSIGGLGNNGYFLADGVIWGYAWATALQDGIKGRIPGNSYWDYAKGDGLPNGTAAEQALYNAYNQTGGTYTDTGGTVHHSVGGQAITNAWLNIPLPASYFTSFNLSPSINPTVGAASKNLHDSYSTGFDDATGVNAGGGSQFGNHQVTVDNLSKGTEVELTAQPIKNWNITVNYSHVQATHENIDTAAQQFIGSMTKFMNGPGGQVRMWGNNGGTLGSDWDQSIVAPFTVELNSLGHEAPEVSPWRLNAVTTYNFDRGITKGFFVGGGLRIDAARIIGYKYDPNYKNVNSTDPNYAEVASVTQGGLNVDEPLMGKNETHVDAWVGYSRKVGHKINWRIQLNLRNVGENDHLITSQENPDGSIALARISQGMTWQLTNSFDF